MIDIADICNLSEEDRNARRQQLHDGLFSHVRGREEMSDGLALFFDATPTVHEQLDDFVAFERQCCPGLGFAIREASGALRLEISGIDPQSRVFADIGPVPQSEQPRARGWVRVVRSAGLGAVGAFVVFCVIPIVLVAVLGAQIAAPLGALDNPWVIGAGTLVFATLLWRWERRGAARAQRASAESCGC